MQIVSICKIQFVVLISCFAAFTNWQFIHGRDLWVQGQAGFIAKRKQQRRTRQADAFLLRPSVPRFDHLVSVRA
jgi:hypothetical protein